jgi:hypothetical protein
VVALVVLFFSFIQQGFGLVSPLMVACWWHFINFMMFGILYSYVVFKLRIKINLYFCKMKKLLYIFLGLSIIFGCSNDSDEPETLNLQIGDIYENGIIFQLNSTGEHGLVASMGDLGGMNWYEAMDSESNGWYIPSINQLESMYITIGQGADNIGNFADGSYWSSTFGGSSNSPYASKFNFANGSSSSGWNPILNFRVRLIRSF